MVIDELMAALKNALERGETLEEAKLSLVNAGYSKAEIEEAAKEIESIKPKQKLFLPSKSKTPSLLTPPKGNQKHSL